MTMRRTRSRWLLKWAGLSTCVALLLLWGASLIWSVTYYGRRWRFDLWSGVALLRVYDSAESRLGDNYRLVKAPLGDWEYFQLVKCPICKTEIPATRPSLCEHCGSDLPWNKLVFVYTRDQPRGWAFERSKWWNARRRLLGPFEWKPLFLREK